MAQEITPRAVPSDQEDLPGPSEGDPLNHVTSRRSPGHPEHQRPAEIDDLALSSLVMCSNKTHSKWSWLLRPEPWQRDRAAEDDATVYAEHGSTITDALGNLIETGGDPQACI